MRKLVAILTLICWHWPYGLFLHTRLVFAAVAAVVVSAGPLTGADHAANLAPSPPLVSCLCVRR